MRLRQDQLEFQKLLNSTCPDKECLTTELQKAEQTGHRLNEQLCSIQVAERELDRLLGLKRKHYNDVEQLLKETANSSLNKRSCLQEIINSRKTPTFFDYICDDDSDTGVSSMNSDEPACKLTTSGKQNVAKPMETLV